jgi:hypothetical protein
LGSFGTAGSNIAEAQNTSSFLLGRACRGKKGAKTNAHSGVEYRKALLKRIQKLRKEGRAFKKIAETSTMKICRP